MKLLRNNFKLILIFLLLWIVVGWVFALSLHSSVRSSMENLIVLRILDGVEMFNANSSYINTTLEVCEENALMKCRILAEFLTQESFKNYKDEKLTRFIQQLHVEEYHIINGNGIVEYSNIPAIIGYDMNSKEQSRQFMPAITDKNFEFIQPPISRGVDGAIFQYIGVARKDAPGIVQIGYDPQRYVDVNTIHSIKKNIDTLRVGEQGYLFICKDKIIIASPDRSLIGKSLHDLYPEPLPQAGDFFEINAHGESYIASYEPQQEYDIFGVLPKAEAYRFYHMAMKTFFLVFIFNLFILTYILYHLNHKKSPKNDTGVIEMKV